MSKMLTLKEDYLKELLDYISRGIVGKLLKRQEIIQNRDVLKAVTKELIYEEFRQLRDLIIAHNKGQEMSIFKFKKPGDTPIQKSE